MGRKLLIVDDHPGIRLLLSDILMNAGYETATADNGKAALEMLLEEQFSLVMLDYNLPIVDGKEIIKKLNEKEIQIPIIVMSGLIEKIENEFESYPYVKQVIAKPFNVIEIPSIVKETLRAS